MTVAERVSELKESRIQDLQRYDGSQATDGPFDLDGAIETLFTYAEWDQHQKNAGVEVRNALMNAYRQIIKNVPPSPTRSRALNNLVDARMLANAAITFHGIV